MFYYKVRKNGDVELWFEPGYFSTFTFTTWVSTGEGDLRELWRPGDVDYYSHLLKAHCAYYTVFEKKVNDVCCG